MIIQVLKAVAWKDRMLTVIVQCVASSKEATILSWLDVSSHSDHFSFFFFFFKLLLITQFALFIF